MNELIPSTPQLPTVAASAEQLRELHDLIVDTLAKGEIAMQRLREMCGGEATGFAGELLQRMNWGLGQFRESDAMLAKAWRAKNAAARAESQTT
jgi:hypothetical protein